MENMLNQKNVFFLSLKKRIAKKEPSGILKKSGDINAIPIIPNFFLAEIIIRVFLVKIFLYLFLLGNL